LAPLIVRPVELAAGMSSTDGRTAGLTRSLVQLYYFKTAVLSKITGAAAGNSMTLDTPQTTGKTSPLFVDIYACYDLLEAIRAQNLLESYGISCRLRDLSCSALPLTIGTFGERRIAVPHETVIQAKQTLGKAIRDGYLSTSGNFCGARVDAGEAA
jgi:hypothetical protein